MHDHGPALPEVHWYGLLGHWTFQPGWLVVCVLLLVGYGAALAAARRHGHATPVGATISFAVGVALLYVTVASGIGSYGEVLFWAHMVEHLALIMVVPTFLALGNPLRLVRSALADPARFDAVLRSRPMRVVCSPMVGFALYALVIIGTHLTSFMDQMMGNPTLALAERVLYLVGGFALMTHLVGDEPYPTRLSLGQRLFSSVVMMTPDTVVGIVLLQSGVDLFPSMAMMRPAWAPSALDDQHTGGALMWAVGDGLMMLVSVGLIIALISSPQRDRVLGGWLDSARTGALRERTGLEEDVDDVDDSDEALEAYNKMLARMSGSDGGEGPRR